MIDHFATYQAAVKNLKAGPHSASASDKFIVDMWGAFKKATEDNEKMVAELEDARKSNAKMYNEIDSLETKIARIQPTAFESVASGADYLHSIGVNRAVAQ